MQIAEANGTYRVGIHSGYRVDFGLSVSGRSEIGFCVHIVFYIIVNHF